MSSQILLHWNLSNLNLHAWLIEPQLPWSRAFLRQWQHKLRHLKESQPYQSRRQSGSFLQSGAIVIMWTSGHLLLYLFQDRKLQPGITDDYRSAIADKLGNLPINVTTLH